MSNRILLISSNSSARGGGERYLVYLTSGLRSIGLDVHVVLSDATYMDLWEHDLTEAGAEVSREKLIGLRDRPLRFAQSILDFRQQRRIKAICRDRNPSAILVNQQYDEDGLDFISGALAAEVAPVGGTIHMPMTAHKDERPFGKLRGRLLQRWYRKHPYNIIVVSQGAMKELHDYYELPVKATIVRYGCPYRPSVAPSPPMPDGWRTEIPTIGFVGQFVTQKNLGLLTKAWAKLTRDGIASQLLLVGDGPDRSMLEKELEATSSSGWFISGWQQHPERYLNCIDIYAMTSLFEGLPLALLEAVGHGLPAVTTNFNGASDVSEKANWVSVVEEPTAESIAMSLQIAIQELDILKKRAMTGQNEFRRYFSVERMAEETIATLQKSESLV